MPDSPLPPEPSAHPARPLRVTIGLLLLWTTMTAMALGLAGRSERSRDEVFHYPESVRRMLRAADMLFFMAAPAYGAAMAVTATAAHRAVMRMGGFPSQPGHWIGILVGIAALGYLAAVVSGSDGPTRRLIGTSIIVLLAVVGCRAFAATGEPRWWRIALLVNAVGLCALVATVIAWQASGLDAVVTPTHLLAFAIPGFAMGVALLLAGLAAILDLVKPPRYDLFHWVGIGTLAVLAAHPVIERGIVYWYR